MNETIQWSATIISIIAASIIAADFGRRATGWAFVIFTAASILWVAFGAIERDYGLLAQNIVLMFINIFGIWKYLIAKRPA